MFMIHLCLLLCCVYVVFMLVLYVFGLCKALSLRSGSYRRSPLGLPNVLYTIFQPGGQTERTSLLQLLVDWEPPDNNAAEMRRVVRAEGGGSSSRYRLAMVRQNLGIDLRPGMRDSNLFRTSSS